MEGNLVWWCSIPLVGCLMCIRVWPMPSWWMIIINKMLVHHEVLNIEHFKTQSTELRNVNYFTWSKTFKLDSFTRSASKWQQFWSRTWKKLTKSIILENTCWQHNQIELCKSSQKYVDFAKSNVLKHFTPIYKYLHTNISVISVTLWLWKSTMGLG